MSPRMWSVGISWTTFGPWIRVCAFPHLYIDIALGFTNTDPVYRGEHGIAKIELVISN